MAGWNELPVELRWMILEVLANDCSFAAYPYARARYASVCREWQPIFERRNFQLLVIDQWRLSDLDRILDVNQRRGCLGHLCFRVQLDDYSCPYCLRPEGEETINKNNNVFTDSVSRLLSVLSRWRTPQGLKLELAAFSPSDGQHTFRDLRLQKDYPYREVGDLERNFDAYRAHASKLALAALHDPNHGWVDGVLDAEKIELGSRLRVTGELKYNFDRPEKSTTKPPKVDIVTTLLVRRQYYRKICFQSLSRLLRNSLISVRRFSYEGLQDVTEQRQAQTDQEYIAMMWNGLPPALRELSIFSQSNKMLHAKQFPRGEARLPLGKVCSTATRNLETFSAGFVIDAEDFFWVFRPTHPLTPDETPGEISAN